MEPGQRTRKPLGAPEVLLRERQAHQVYYDGKHRQKAQGLEERRETIANFHPRILARKEVIDQVDISWLPHPDYFIGRSGAEVPPLHQVPGAAAQSSTQRIYQL